MDPLFDFTDKVVLVTGGSRGLGLEAAREAAGGARPSGQSRGNRRRRAHARQSGFNLYHRGAASG
jgi:NAD(P)-dependent dehydrogenase (short-subunit alcohol dehydrogenase family)